jgi:DMSO/TMAO reductase YedYZ molybdopterin-dependent catalytic subunit
MAESPGRHQPFLVSRRTWFLSTLGLWIPRTAPPRAASIAQEQVVPAAGEPIGMSRPAVSTSLEAVQNGITPADQFYVRSHFADPELSMANWRLRVEGKVANPIDFSFSDLLAAPIQKLEALLECAGNLQLLVSNGVWEGVPMSYLLKEAAPTRDARQMMLEGSDSGVLMPGFPPYPFASIVPLAKCLAPETLVAFRLNGQFLPPRNGFPARALVGGWYAMDSVKWLQRIVLLGPDDRPGSFYRSGRDKVYTRLINQAGGEQITAPVTDVQVRSNIAYPLPNAKLAAGHYTVWGFAWAGANTISKVEVSLDSGHTWRPAMLDGVSKALTWVKWKYRWEATPGNASIMSRATDSRGNAQPLVRDRHRLDSWEANWCKPVDCSII